MDLFRQSVLCDIEIIVHLKFKPERCRITKISREAESCISGNASLPVNDLVYSAGGDPKAAPELVLTDIHWFEEFLKQYLSRMYYLYVQTN